MRIKGGKWDYKKSGVNGAIGQLPICWTILGKEKKKNERDEQSKKKESKDGVQVQGCVAEGKEKRDILAVSSRDYILTRSLALGIYLAAQHNRLTFFFLFLSFFFFLYSCRRFRELVPTGSMIVIFASLDDWREPHGMYTAGT